MTIKSFYSEETLPNSVIESMIIGRNDKRDFIRMNIESEVTFSRPGSNEVFTGKTIDLSATGVRFSTKAELQAGETVSLSVKPGVENLTPPLDVTLEIVRVDQTENGEYDVAGVIKTPD